MIQVINKYGAVKAPAPAPSSAIWGTIVGAISAQLDLTSYLSSNFYPLSNPSSYISGITSGDVTTALGYTPANVANTFQTLTIVSSATPSIAVGSFNLTNYSITAQAVALTSITIVGTPSNFDKLTLTITDNGTARALALGTSFIAGECVIPTTTKISIPLTLMFLYDSVTSKYKCIFTSYDSGLLKRGAGNYSILSVNDTTSSAAGNYSISGGQYSNASGTGAAAFGNSTVGTYSIGSGYSCGAAGSYAKVSGYACAGAGNSSSAEGTYAAANGDSAHAEGRSTTATGGSSHAGGASSLASLYGEWCRSSGGNLSQYGINELVGVTTDATTTTLYLGNAGSSYKFLIPSNSCYRVYLTANIRDGAWNVKEFSGTALIKNVAGTTSLVGTCTMTSALGDVALAACTIAVSADNTNDQLKVDVTGIAATTINWSVKCDYVKIK
jgi:hypothetical protein